MLTKEENERLTRVGPGTPMGTLFRRYWLPVLLAEELPEPDGAPVRVTVLGEPLVAFRDTGGRVGLLDAYCAHRSAGLFWGRNEENGLRCVYHGWKYDLDGACVDMPSEPSDRAFKEKVHLTAYPTREAGAMIWAYMGPRGTGPSQAQDGSARDGVPDMPQLEWTLVPPSHRYVHKRYQECNYLQNVEGEVDSSHVSFLHRRLRPDESAANTLAGQRLLLSARDYAPTFTVADTDYGLVIGARRDWGESDYYWRITQFLMPSYTMIPSEPGYPISYTAAVPIDDHHMWGYTVTWRPDRPLSEDDVARIESWTGIYSEVDPATYTPTANRGNDYLIDRAKQRVESFSGIRGIRDQDLAVQEDQRGPITDRTREYLGSSDSAVLAMRRKLLTALREIERGDDPVSARNAGAYRVRSAALLAPRDRPFEDVAAGCWIDSRPALAPTRA